MFVFLGIKGVWNGIGKAKYDVGNFSLFTFLSEVPYWHDRHCTSRDVMLFVDPCRYKPFASPVETFATKQE